MRILIAIFLFLGAVIFSLAAVIRMEDKYPANETRHASCPGALPAAPQTERDRRARRLLEETLAADRGAGIVAAVMIDGELVWSDAVGHADRRTGAIQTEHALMRTGSVSKPITAALAAKLHEAGRLDIDAPIQTYVPEFPDKGAPITIRFLAAHLAGIRQYDFANFDEANSRLQYDNLSDAIEIFAQDPLMAPPGDEYRYTSLGYNLIGAAIERATGQSFGDALSAELAEPLNLKSFVVDNPETHVPCRARFHTVYFGKAPLTTIWRNHSDAYPSAGILASARDLARFADEVFAGDFFAPDTAALFRDQIARNDGALTNRTFGWEVFFDDDGDVLYYGHGGLTNGAVAELRYYPEQKLSMAIVSNYNLFLTDRYPQFSTLYDKDLPALFGAGQ